MKSGLEDCSGCGRRGRDPQSTSCSGCLHWGLFYQCLGLWLWPQGASWHWLDSMAEFCNVSTWSAVLSLGKDSGADCPTFSWDHSVAAVALDKNGPREDHPQLRGDLPLATRVQCGAEKLMGPGHPTWRIKLDGLYLGLGLLMGKRGRQRVTMEQET